jgi:hypothetical protein
VGGSLALLAVSACSLGSLDDLKGDAHDAGSGGSAAASDGAAGGVGGGVGGGGGWAGSGGVAGSSGVGGSGGSASTESCTNGIDDDGNQLVDCADPACATLTQCVPSPPTNWIGPVWLGLAASASALPACPSAVPAVAEGGTGTPSAAALSCTACACANPTGGQCTMASSSNAYGGGGCSGAIVSISPKAGVCYDFPAISGTNYPNSFKPPAVTVVGSSCAASGGTETSRPAPVFAQMGRACLAPAAGGCAPGSACAPTAPPAFEPGACVLRTGDQICPSTFPKKTVLYDGAAFDDTRACGACTCGTPTGRKCSGTFLPYLGPGCTNPWGGQPQPVEETPNCFPGGSDYRSLVITPGNPSGGTCAAATGAQTGTVTPKNPTTVCCQ